jgi:hypothetical protein
MPAMLEDEVDVSDERRQWRDGFGAAWRGAGAGLRVGVGVPGAWKLAVVRSWWAFGVSSPAALPRWAGVSMLAVRALAMRGPMLEGA